MADQDNTQFGGQGGAPMPGVPMPVVPPIPMPGVPMPVVPPIPMPGVPTPVVQPMPMPGVPMPVVQPMPMPGVPMPVVPPMPMPASEPKKPMTLDDLAKQTPIFSDEELEEDDFDPWAPLNENVKNTVQDKSDIGSIAGITEPPAKPAAQAKPSQSIPSQPIPEVAIKTTPVREEPEVIEGSLLDEDEIDPFEGLEEEEEHPIKQLLANANLNGKKIIGCMVAFISIILLIVGLIYGGKALFGLLSEEPTIKEPVIEEPVIEDPVEEPKKESVKKENSEDVLPAGWIEPSLYAGIKIGFEATEGVDTTIPGIPEMDISSSGENIVEYVSILATIRAFYETDIQLMLNGSTDRNRSLNDFLAGMKSASAKAYTASSAIALRKSVLQTEFDAVTVAKQIQENEYFTNLSANNAKETSRNLENFTILARQSVDIRARYRALNKLEEYINKYAVAMDTRIRDVEFNREALIKGIKVIDVAGSDIDLVIPESDL